jgi:hypothetical protein
MLAASGEHLECSFANLCLVTPCFVMCLLLQACSGSLLFGLLYVPWYLIRFDHSQYSTLATSAASFRISTSGAWTCRIWMVRGILEHATWPQNTANHKLHFNSVVCVELSNSRPDTWL